MSEYVNREDFRDSDLVESLTSGGRDNQQIITPRYLGHFGQPQARQLGEFAEELMIEAGVDPEVAKNIRTRFVTRGLGSIVNISGFGYAARVLEERAGLSAGEDYTEDIK